MFDVITRLDNDTFIASGSIGTYMGMIMMVEGKNMFKWIKLPTPNTTEADMDLYYVNDDYKMTRIKDIKKVLKPK